MEELTLFSEERTRRKFGSSSFLINVTDFCSYVCKIFIKLERCVEKGCISGLIGWISIRIAQWSIGDSSGSIAKETPGDTAS